MAESDLVDYYSRRAREYERIYHKPERQGDLAALRRLVAELLVDQGVLEIACGTGYWTEVIAKAARSILATDASDATLEVARHKSYPEGRVRFLMADAFHPNAVGGRFTALFCGFFWSHIPRAQLGRFLAGLRARLGAGCRLLFIDNRFVAGSSTPIAGTDAAGNTYQLRRLDDGSDHRVLKNFPDEDELRRSLSTVAGQVRVANLTYYWCLTGTTRPDKTGSRVGISRPSSGALA
jgi:demethylmenaquinone methyltransferase/2-methoxy-6-polyprenyl-1,4-benzoquinol methylase